MDNIEISKVKPYEKNTKKHPEKQLKQCRYCGKIFNKSNKLSYKQWEQQNYCSVACVNNNSVKIKYNCLECNKEFYDYPSNGKRKFCSLICKSDFSRIDRICKNCNKVFSINKSVLRTNTAGNFCCRECYNIWMCQTDRVRGRGSRWKQIRKAFKKDNFFCAFCGSEENLEVHHIIPFRLSYNNREDNLITLCKKHHKFLENVTYEIESVENNYNRMKKMIKNIVSDKINVIYLYKLKERKI